MAKDHFFHLAGGVGGQLRDGGTFGGDRFAGSGHLGDELVLDGERREWDAKA